MGVKIPICSITTNHWPFLSGEIVDKTVEVMQQIA